MTNPNQLLHFDISTPRGPQPADGQPLAIMGDGAGREPMQRNLHLLTGAGGDPTQLRQARGLPASFNPERERSVTPRRGGALALLRSGSSPPERREALSMFQSWRQRPDTEQFWRQCTEDALRVQQQRFEEVAASYMLETKQAFQTERAEWQRSLLAEEQRMAAHGRREAEVERNQVEHQMMEAFKQYATQQSSQFELAAQAERRYLATAVKSEVEILST